MAALQGYLLQYKDSLEEAIIHIDTFTSRMASSSSITDDAKHQEQQYQKKSNIKPRPVKALTVEEVDKMVFNPQKDWDQTG
jgi:excinuclease UvrABC helicase subunit UvrB